MNVCYNFFQANYYYSFGVSLVMRKNAEGALGYFTKAIHFDPLKTEYRQYRAHTLSTTLQLGKFFSSARGDNKAPSNDYERALKDFQIVEKHNPNHALLHQSKGQLFYSMAIHKSQEADHAKSAAEHHLFRTEAISNMEQAKTSFKRSLITDPVNQDTYAFLTSIALMERNPLEALNWISLYRQGPDGVTEEEFLQKNRQNTRFISLQQQALRMLNSDGKK
jgi:tetratricopeptide (TPR) repeat protein